MRGYLKVWVLLSILIIMGITAGTQAQNLKNGGAVPISLVEKSADYYAQKKWPGCQFISSTPYYALDGSIEAYAVVFSKPGSSLKNVPEIYERATKTDEYLQDFRSSPPASVLSRKQIISGENNTPPPASPVQDIGEESNSQILPFTGVARAPSITKEMELKNAAERKKAAFEAEEKSGWYSGLRKATEASVMKYELGTVVMSARYDLYPVLEIFDGAPPHITAASQLKRMSGSKKAADNVITRSYYMGPTSFFHEVASGTKSGGSSLIDPVTGMIYDMNKARTKSGTGRLPAATHGKCSIPAVEFWDSFDKTGKAPVRKTPEKGREKSDHPIRSNIIEDVPHYDQNWFGSNACAPTAIAQVFAFWDERGYGNLVDCGSPNDGTASHNLGGNYEELVYDIMRAVSYTPEDGTLVRRMAGGIRNVLTQDAYSNMTKLFSGYDEDVYWISDIVNEVDAGRPFVYSNWERGTYPNWAHSTTGVGYDYDGTTHWLWILTWNYLKTDINYDNIPGGNETAYRVLPDATVYGNVPYDCVWSEDFEGSYWYDWDRRMESPGSSWWHSVDYFSHNSTIDPRPPGGDRSYSAFCSWSSSYEWQNYQPDADNWLIYGPFSTYGRTTGEFSAYIWREIPDSHDKLNMLVSTDGVNFTGGNSYSGSDRSWKRYSIDLADVSNMGSVLDKPKVWVAFHFESDSDGTVGKGVYVDDVTIKLSQSVVAQLFPPSNVTATSNDTEKVIVSCDPVSGATHYRFSRTTTHEPQKRILGGWQTSTTYENKSGSAGKNYFYWVEAASSPNGMQRSPYSLFATGVKRPKAPTSIQASNIYENRIEISWNTAPDCNYYHLYRSEDLNTAEAIGKWQANTTFTDRSAEKSKVYYYLVKASRYYDGRNPSALSSHAAGQRILKAADSVEATDGKYESKVRVEWTFSHTYFYRVYRGTAPGRTPEPVTEWVNSSMAFDNTAVPGTTYFYYVNKALDSNGKGESDFGANDRGWAAMAKPINIVASDGWYSDKIHVTWTGVSGASHYMLAVSLTPEGTAKYPLTCWQEGLSYDYITDPGKIYYFWVAAAKSIGGYHATDFTGPEEGWQALTPPKNLRATDGNYTNFVQVEWDALSGIDYYRVYRAEMETEPRRSVSGWITGTIFNDSSAVPARNYYYWVKAGSDANGTHRSGYSNSDEGFRRISAPENVRASDGTHSGAILVEWDAYTGAEKYGIYRAESLNGPWANRGLYHQGTSYEDSAFPGKKYYYRMKTYANYQWSSDYSNVDDGWAAAAKPENLKATDGLYSDKVVINWSSTENIYYRVSRSETVSGAKEQLNSWTRTSEFVDTTAAPGIFYYYRVQAALDASGLGKGDMSDSDIGFRAASKYGQEPNITDGYDNETWKDYKLGEYHGKFLYDDWECPDGLKIVTVKWWGSYLFYRQDTDQEVSPPSDRPFRFNISWYEYDSGTPDHPGTLKGTYQCSISNANEKWVRAIPDGSGSYFEHEFEYRCSLPSPWEQLKDQKYFLHIMPEFNGYPGYTWGWLNSEQHWGNAVMEPQDGGMWAEINWRSGHRLEGRPMDMAFELLSFPPTPTTTPTPVPTGSPTPSPTPTPTPEPTPTAHWEQMPNEMDGFDLLSWRDNESDINYRVIDDWEISDGKSIGVIRWYGSYPGYAEDTMENIDPPDERPNAFVLSWYEYIPGPPVQIGALLKEEICYNYEETGGFGIIQWDDYEKFEHEYKYECVLSSPWEPQSGTKYFLGIQARFSSSDPLWKWGWLNADFQ
jgi:fibronectin type 3 domain-containing protein